MGGACLYSETMAKSGWAKTDGKDGWEVGFICEVTFVSEFEIFLLLFSVLCGQFSNFGL